MSTKLTRHIFLRLSGPNKGPECCLGGAGHAVVPLFGVGMDFIFAASSGDLALRSGEVVKIFARSWILGRNGFLWSC